MKNISLIAILGLTSLFSSGCSSHSVRSGVWVLRFDAQDSRTREAMGRYPGFPEAHQVELFIEKAREKPGEAVEIRMIATKNDDGIQRNRKVLPLYGFIEEGSEKIVIDGGDKTWVFKFVGTIHSEEYIKGDSFLARMRLEDEAIEGLWSMKWLAD